MEALLLAGYLGLAACHIYLILFAHELASAPANRRSRGPGRTPQRTVSWLWASPVPAVTAVLAAIGTAPLAEPVLAARNVGALGYALIPAASALAGAVWSVRALARRSRGVQVSRSQSGDVLAAATWLVTTMMMVPTTLPLLINEGGRSITDQVMLALIAVPGPAWILLRRRSRRRRLHQLAAVPMAPVAPRYYR